MQAQTGAQPRPGAGTDVAPRTATLAAVADPARRAVVAGADNAVVVRDEHAADAPLHAVGALRGEGGERHEVRIPGRAEPRRRDDVQCGERGVELRDGGEVVEDVQVRARREVGRSAVEDGGVAATAVAVEGGVAPRHEGGERWGWDDGAALAAVAEALEAERDRRVDTDEHEEGPSQQALEGGVVADVGQDPVLAPALRDEVEQGVDVGEREASGAPFVGHRWAEACDVFR